MVTLSCFNWVQLIKKSDLPANAKYLGLYLATFMNAEHDVAWPSMERISNETGLTKMTARKWLDYLHEQKWLIKRKNAREMHTLGGVQLQNEYLVNIPEDVLRGVNDLLPSPKGGITAIPRGDNCYPKGGKQLSPNNNIITNNNNREGRFAPPSVKEVSEYCQERQNRIDPETFVDFYTSNGWMRGKTKIKDWKACIRTWEKRDGNKQQAPKPSLAERATNARKEFERKHHGELVGEDEPPIRT